MGKKGIDGNHTLYHYLQKVVALEDDTFSSHLIGRLIIDLSIWFPPSLYRSLPIFLPYCLRDPSCRSSGLDGKDEWGSANAEGYLRDDNSLLKGVSHGLKVSSPGFNHYHRQCLMKGFVASHVWREVVMDGKQTLASRHPRLYSFIPNVAWLPVQISKLTDREGSYAQKVFLALATQIYKPSRHGESPEMAALWDALPSPELELDIDLDKINYFQPDESWVIRRKKNLGKEIGTILTVLNGSCSTIRKVKSSRYLPSLQKSTKSASSNLGPWLRGYMKIADLSCVD